MVWTLDEFVKMDLSLDSVAVERRRLAPHAVNEVELTDHGVRFPLKAESERVNPR